MTTLPTHAGAKRLAAVALCGLVLSASACGEDAPQRSPSALTPPRLELAFTLSLAGVQFSGRGDADATSDGRIAVLDVGAHRVYVFDTTGALAMTLGREGRGPGEIAGGSDVETGPDGEVAVADGATNRVTIWSRSGAVLGTTSVGEGGTLFGLWWVGRDLYARLQGPRVALVGRLDVARGRLAWAVSSPAGDGGEAGCQFCIAAVGPGGSVIFAAADTLYRLSELDRSGTLRRTWSREGLPAARYSAAEREEFARGMRLGSAIAGASAEGAPEFKARIRGKALAVDSLGRIWALPSRPDTAPSIIDVFSPEGPLLASASSGAILSTITVRHGLLVSLGETLGGEPAVFVFRIREGPAAAPGAAADSATVRTTLLRGHVLLASDRVVAPSFVAVVGRFVIAIDERADSVIKVVDRLGGRYVRSFGRRGRGPGEFEGPWSISPVAGSASAFWVFDVSLRRLTHVDLDRDFVEPGLVGRRMVTLNAGFTVLDPAVLDSVIVAVGFLPSGRLAFFSARGDLVRTAGGDPPGDPSVPVAVRNHAYQAELAVSPDRTSLAVANRHAGSIEFYRADGTPVTRVSGPSAFEPILLVARGGQGPAFVSDERLRFGYIAVAATRDRVFALFSGRTRRDFPGAAAFGKSVHVFDWEGRLLRVYDLEGAALAIAVDGQGTALYVAQHEPEPAIVSYPLGDVGRGK